jgi:hypothetical protein
MSKLIRVPLFDYYRGSWQTALIDPDDVIRVVSMRTSFNSGTELVMRTGKRIESAWSIEQAESEINAHRTSGGSK